MAKNENATIVLNGVEYALDQMNEEQRALLAHATDLDRKISSARFNVDQMEVGRQAFVDRLAASLAAEAPKEAAE
jgi:cell division protein ZapA (FtsZ GTPase activity inhibitor)